MDKIDRFVKSKLFIFICAIYYFLVWVTGQEAIGLCLAMFFASFLLIFYKNMTGVTTIISLAITGVSLKQFPVAISYKYSNTVPSFVIPLAIVTLSIFVLSLIIHFVKFKPSREIWRDPLTYCFFAIFCVTLLGGIFSKTFSFFISALLMLLYLILFLFYRLFKSCDPSFDFKEYAALIAVMIGVSATADLIIYYIGVESFYLALMHKSAQIGWGVTNSIAPYMVLGIPMATFLYIKRRNFVYIFMAFFQLTGLILTMCRGEIAAFVIISPALVFFFFRYAKKEWGEIYKLKRFEFIGMFAVFILGFTIIGITNYDYFKDFISRIFNMSESGRSQLRHEAALVFMASPFFGGGFSKTGFGFGLSFINESFNIMMPHSILYNLFATMGIFGAAVFGVYYYFKYRQLLTVKSLFSIFVLLAIIPFVSYAFADPTFYFVNIQFVSLLLLEALRREAAEGKCAGNNITAVFRKRLFVNKLSTYICFAVGLVLSALLIALFFMIGNAIFIINVRTSYNIMVVIACLIEVTLMPSAYRIITNFFRKRKRNKLENSNKDKPDIANRNQS